MTESKAVQTGGLSTAVANSNYELHLDISLLQSNQTQEAKSLPVLMEEVKEAVHSLKAGKSPGVDNVPSELLKNGGEATTTVLTAICKKIWKTKECLREWTQSLVTSLPKKANSSNVTTIVPSASLTIPARLCP